MSNLTPPRPDVYLAIARNDEVTRRLPSSQSTWLSDSEQTRLQRLHVAARHDHYLAGHWLVRELLAEAFAGSAPGATSAENWRLLDIKSQAPRVSGYDHLHVSISHSDQWVAAAVAQQPVGIDLEQRPRALDPAIQSLLLSPHEVAGDIGNDELLQRWVAKEAWLKMRGESALPERLRQLRLHATRSELANVISYRSDDFHFAVANAQAATLTWTITAGVVGTAAYRLEPIP